MVFTDVVTDPAYTELKATGLEPLLKRHGVDVQPGFALRAVPPALLGRSELDTLPASAPRDATNPIAKQFWREGFAILMRRSARTLAPDKATSRYKVETLLQLDRQATREFFLVPTAPSALRDPTRFEVDLINSGKIEEFLKNEPIPVAVAVSESQGEKPRLLVFGDTDFIGNFDLMRSPNDQNFAMVLSGLEWMAEREGFIGPVPRETTVYALSAGPESDTVSRMVHVPGWLMLLSLLGLGTGIWLVRRR
jgi:hypothetical protein